MCTGWKSAHAPSMKIIYFSSLKTLLESNCYNLNKTFSPA